MPPPLLRSAHQGLLQNDLTRLGWMTPPLTVWTTPPKSKKIDAPSDKVRKEKCENQHYHPDYDHKDFSPAAPPCATAPAFAPRRLNGGRLRFRNCCIVVHVSRLHQSRGLR
jgi:hypothetical protein